VSIAFDCPHCRRREHVTDTLAGRTGHCPYCGGLVDIPLRSIEPVERPSPVAVVNFDMPFLSMVSLMVKWAIASIPAAIILATIVGGFLMATAAVLFRGMAQLLIP
jgi:hypothetical protein